MEAPRELREIEARIERLHESMLESDPSLATDELQATIERA
jgi:hypothetical protein